MTTYTSTNALLYHVRSLNNREKRQEFPDFVQDTIIT